MNEIACYFCMNKLKLRINMKTILCIAMVLVGAMSLAQRSFYDYTVEDIEGNTFDLSQLKGKKVMVVNVASKCGLTPQYRELQAIYDEYGQDDFVIIGFPANNFLSQEPGSNEEIASFCEKNYGVTFPMMAKISVKGKDMHPLYQFLTTKEQNGVSDSEVSWNFQKYLINEKGELVKVISPRTKPNDAEIIGWITSK
jgi:glutathione peroxidase